MTIDEEALKAGMLAITRQRFDVDTPEDILEFQSRSPQMRLYASAAITAYLTALADKGYVIVPSEPTWLMEQAGEAALRKPTARPAIRDAYCAMLAARGE